MALHGVTPAPELAGKLQAASHRMAPGWATGKQRELEVSRPELGRGPDLGRVLGLAWVNVR